MWHEIRRAAAVAAVWMACIAPCGTAWGMDDPSRVGAPIADAEMLLLNKATAEELAALDGVDATSAERIVGLRQARGRLNSVEELRIIHSLSTVGLDSLRERTAIDVQMPLGATTTEFANAGDVLDHFSHEPTVQQVHQWANSYARTSPDLVQRWLAASKSFAALPQLTLEYRFRDGWDQDFLYQTADGNDPSSPDEDVFPTLEDGGRDQDAWYLVRMRWDLQELVMSSERIRVISEAQDIAKLRDRVLSQATQLYFERRRLQVEMLLAPRGDVMGQVKDQLRLMELTANLDALTGGAFSSAVARSSG
ncbi:MAG: hypothetical protein ACI8PZ_000638 [Myxococcota bacterium]|jgi:hypothetical protein